MKSTTQLARALQASKPTAWGLAAAALLLCPSAAVAQDVELPSGDELLQIVLDSIDAADSAAQMVGDLYEFDKEACIAVRGDEAGGTISVLLDEELVGDYAVNDEGRVMVSLPSAAELGSTLTVLGADGNILLATAVLQRTYFRGNVVETGNYGDNEPDIVDVLFLYDHVFQGGPAPVVFEHGDVDGSGAIDVTDVLNLYDHVTGGLSYYLPFADVTHDGSFTTANTYLASTIEELGNWGKGINCPPKKNQGAKPKDLDGKPKTKEWTFPCTHTFVPGFPGYSTMSTAWGPRNPNTTPDGGNSAFIRMLYCVTIVSGEPVVTRKPMGKCMWPNGRNLRSFANGKATYTSRNPDAPAMPGDPALNATYKFETDVATCKLTITLDSDGNGSFETPVYSGDPSSWSGWPAGV